MLSRICAFRVMCATVVAAVATAHASLAVQPATTISYYIDMAPSEFATYEKFLAAYERVGCMEARHSRGGLVMLDFGESRYSKPAHAWGHNAWSPVHKPPEGLGPWMIDRDMERAVERFAQGLKRCRRAGDFYVLALGVNNNNYEPVNMLTAGKVWGRLVQSVDSGLIRDGNAEAAWAIGGIDAEAGFGSVSDTVDWIRGYNAATAMSRYTPLIDFGDLECSFVRHPPSCGSGWTLWWHWWVSWGNGHTLALPEIYGFTDRFDHLSDAQKWARLAAFGVARKGHYGYAGAIAEQQVPKAHYDPLFALQRLEEAESGARGITIVPLATNITWCLLDDATAQAQHDTWCTYNGLHYAPPLGDVAQFTAASAPALFSRGVESELKPPASMQPLQRARAAIRTGRTRRFVRRENTTESSLGNARDVNAFGIARSRLRLASPAPPARTLAKLTPTNSRAAL